MSRTSSGSRTLLGDGGRIGWHLAVGRDQSTAARARLAHAIVRLGVDVENVPLATKMVGGPLHLSEQPFPAVPPWM